MPNTTEIYGLTKPLPEEFYDIAVHNNNMDRIDELFYRAIHGSGTLADGSNANSLAGNNTWYSLNPDYTYVNFPVTGNWCILIIHDKSAILQVLNGGMFYCNNLAMDVPEWIQLLDTKGDTTIDGSLSVNHGSGTFVSWFLNGETGSAIDAYLENKIARMQVNCADDVRAYLSFFNGVNWENSKELIHSGNINDYISSAGLTPASIE